MFDSNCWGTYNSDSYHFISTLFYFGCWSIPLGCCSCSVSRPGQRHSCCPPSKRSSRPWRGLVGSLSGSNKNHDQLWVEVYNINGKTIGKPKENGCWMGFYYSLQYQWVEKKGGTSSPDTSPIFPWRSWDFPVIFHLNQSIETWLNDCEGMDGASWTCVGMR